MNRSTPKRFESRDYYQRPGQRSTSTEKEKKRLGEEGALFHTNLTSVNIATAFARARINSDTIKRRPSHLKGTPMSPSQIPHMNLSGIPEGHDPRTHFESAAAPRPHGARPVRDITSKSAARHAMAGYQDMDVDSPGYAASGQTGGAVLPDGFLRERNWDQAHTVAPAWLRRVQSQRNQPEQQDIMQESPPPGIFDTPSHAIGRSGIAGAATLSFDPLTDNLIDMETPYPERAASGAGGDVGRPVSSVHARNSHGRAYMNGGTTVERTADNRLRGTALTASADHGGDKTTEMPGARNRYSRPYEDSGQDAYAAYRTSADYGDGDDDPPAAGAERARTKSGKTPRPQSRYSLRSYINTPGRLSYDRDFNPHEEGHDEYQRKDSDTASRRSMHVPTPYTARIKGPGAFPATAQRFSQRRPTAHDVSDNNNAPSPTHPRRPLTRTASGNAALVDVDLLTNHRYLSHGDSVHRGWGEYTQNEDAAERETVHSFSDSFISNSTAGGGDNGEDAERDNPTLMKRLLRNIAAGWSGSTGSFAERLSFVFFMLYFLVKETCVVLGMFLFRLAFNCIIGPVYSGIREVILLPTSLWNVLTPGNSYDTAQSMKHILTGLSVVALSIVAGQYGQPVLSSLGDLSGLSPASGWRTRAPLPITPPVNLEPLTDEEVDRLGGHGSAVVSRLISVEQMINQLYSLLDNVKSHHEDETQDVRESLKRLQQERQTLIDNKRGEQQRIDNLEREYSSMKRDIKVSSANGAETTKLAKELQTLKKYIDKLAKSSSGKGKDSGTSLADVRQLVNDAIKVQESDLRAMLQPEWLTTDGDAAYANVARMIEGALNRYTNDRLGKTDFALFSVGSRIIRELTSPTFEPPASGLRQRLWRGMGMVSSHQPTTILDPDTHVGECWPMLGSSGQVAIHLAQPVDVSDFAIEHVARSIAIDWRSAPRHIEVWGYVFSGKSSDGGDATDTLKAGEQETMLVNVQSQHVLSDITGHGDDETNAEPGGTHTDGADIAVSDETSANEAGEHTDTSTKAAIENPPLANNNPEYGIEKLTLLASHEYAPSDASALQIIRPITHSENADGTIRVRTIILKIKSNWGHPNHTCLYRFRVHGHPVAI
ncbi:hypothetical protein H4R24_002876 [Coemansia sp. RSA 988]|nr:hypothetical protein H4R24_002876 [Coemansia sp. RSA 988]